MHVYRNKPSLTNIYLSMDGFKYHGCSSDMSLSAVAVTARVVEVDLLVTKVERERYRQVLIRCRCYIR